MSSRTTSNAFGTQSYWNRPIGARAGRTKSKYASFKMKPRASPAGGPTSSTLGSTRSPALSATSRQETETRHRVPPVKSRSSSRSSSPTSSNMSHAHLPASSLAHAKRSQAEEDDAKDEKALIKIMKSTLPQFTNETDWELAIFELKLILARVWPHKDKMDITDYMTCTMDYAFYTKDMEMRADNLIYYALTLAAKKGSYAKLQIVAACHRDAVPCVLVNEGKKLFQMFQGLFTMTNLHQASLPTVRANFYSITQHEKETILAYTSRVDIIVATLAKLGEKVSPGAWIYALGNGLRHEYKESKDGILYNKIGFDTVMSVKTKLLSEEAVLTSKDKNSNAVRATKDQHDEIALQLKDLKLSTKKTPKEAKAKAAEDKAAEDQALLFIKGKGGKGSTKGKGKGWNNWNEHDSSWNHQWHGGKGKGKPEYTKPFDPQGLWCSIHQKYGHST